MAFIETLKQRAQQQQRLANARKRAAEEQQGATATPRTTTPSPSSKFIRGIQAEIPRFMEEKAKRRRGVIEFGKGVLRDIPRSAAALALKATGQEKFVPGAGVAPGVEKFLFGKEPIKTPEATGAEMLRGFGVGEERAQQFGGALGYPLAALGAVPIFSGKKRLAKEAAKAVIPKKAVTRPAAIERGIRAAAAQADVPPKAITEPAAAIEGATKPSPGFRERGFITRVKETSPELKLIVKGQYIPRSTDRLAIKARNLIKDDIVTAEKMAREGADDKAVAVAAELMNHYNNLARIARTELDKMKFYNMAGDIAHEIAPKLTEGGRLVQASAIYGRLTPEGILRFSARQIEKYNEEIAKVPPLIRRIQRLPDKLPKMTGGQVKELVEEARRITAMPDGEDKALAFHQLHNRIAELVPTPLMNQIITTWKAGLLTGLTTTGLNAASNLFHGIAEVVKDVPAAAVDSVAALFTGQRTMALTLRGLGPGAKRGYKEGWKYLGTGLSKRDIGAKLDRRRTNFGKSPFGRAAQKYVETIFRFIGAQDQAFYYGALDRAIYSQAIARAMNKKLRGVEARRFADDLFDNPTDDMLKNAVLDAETSVFQHKTALGILGGRIQRLGGGVGEVVVPFARTPSAVAMQILNYSPIGVARALGMAILHYNDFASVQRQFSMAMGRGITGTAIMGLGAHLFEKGRISLRSPRDAREKEQRELEGWAPNSIKIGGKWRRAHIFGPPGLMLLWGGYMRQFYEETGSHTAAADMAETFLKSLGGIAGTFTEQTFVRGIDSALGLITDPERNWQRGVSTLLGPLGPSAVPTIVSHAARATDPYQRNIGEGVRGIFIDGLKARIPGLRQQLQPRVDVAGQVVERPVSPIQTMIDPTRPSKVKTSPTITELARLSTAGHRVTPTDIGGRHGFGSLTPEQNTLLEQDAGQRLFRALDVLFNSEEYAGLTDEDKARTIQNFTEKSRINARARLLKEVLYGPDGPKGEALTAKIEELKADRVLTQGVRKKLLEILGGQSI